MISLKSPSLMQVGTNSNKKRNKNAIDLNLYYSRQQPILSMRRWLCPKLETTQDNEKYSTKDGVTQNHYIFAIFGALKISHRPFWAGRLFRQRGLYSSSFIRTNLIANFIRTIVINSHTNEAYFGLTGRFCVDGRDSMGLAYSV